MVHRFRCFVCGRTSQSVKGRPIHHCGPHLSTRLGGPDKPVAWWKGYDAWIRERVGLEPDDE